MPTLVSVCPSRDDVERFATGRAGAAERRLFLSHLLERCPTCGEQLEAWLHPTVDPEGIDAAIDAAIEKVLAGSPKQSCP